MKGTMTAIRTDWRHFEDVRRDSDLRNPPKFAEPVHGFGYSVGELIAAEIAAAGKMPLVFGGRIPCETDYLAASGATFPADVPRAKLEEFNRETLREVMDETAEMERYVAIASFFRRAAE